jgi:hypothetical protein
MRKRTNKVKNWFLITGIILTFPLTGFSQTKSFLKSIDLGIDYSKLPTLAFPKEKKYEALAAVNFGFGLSIDGEYGYTKKSPEGLYKNGSYTFEGTYYRFGLGYNYGIGDNATIGLGGRYAISSFEDHTEYKILSTIFNEYYEESGVKSHSAQWWELVLKTEGGIKKIKNLKMGMFIRVKFLKPLSKEEDPNYEKLSSGIPYFPVQGIPGYGLAKGDQSAAVNLYIKYSIPLSK